jgi:hypothetical protein
VSLFFLFFLAAILAMFSALLAALAALASSSSFPPAKISTPVTLVSAFPPSGLIYFSAPLLVLLTFYSVYFTVSARLLSSSSLSKTITSFLSSFAASSSESAASQSSISLSSS